MPRIDPIQLLDCLSVLLSPNGGIKSTGEVQRLVGLMTKFSKKLVSKCIYVQILKCTETELLGLFMSSGGWRLVHTWLTESIVVKNWPLVRELLELLLLCPVDIERLKTNNCPKLVKELSKDGNHFAIRALASKLVEQWLKTVKGDHVTPVQVADIPQIVADAQVEITETPIKSEVRTDHETADKNIKTESKPLEPVTSDSTVIDNDSKSKVKQETEKECETLPVLKISVKDGKQVVSQVDENDCKDAEDLSDKDKSKERHKNKSKEKSSSSKSSKSSKHSSKSHSSSNDKDKSHKSSSSGSSVRHSSSSSKDRSKDKEKERHSSSHESKSKSENSKRSSSSSNKSKDDKDKSKLSSDKEKTKHKIKEETKTEKSNERLPRPEDKTPSVHKLGKIPKLSDVKKEKPSISIEVRKPDEPKPKTVKTFHSKFRKHGLEEEVKPPPSRAALLSKKNPPVLPPTIPVPKRPSPVHNETPPEKKPKPSEPIEKPGSIKLIPPKPKPMMLLESDMFMDALTASATNKKEPKKRKRRTSGSKDGNAPNDASPPGTPTTTSPSSEKSVPPKFYQDTLDTEETKEKPANKNSESTENGSDKEDSMDMTEPHTLTVNGLRGVLCYHKKKGPKKSIKWKPDSELEEIQYFELDETERVNVTKTFTDMKHLERINEREAFQKARNLANDDVMEEKTNWKPLILIDAEGQILVEHGKNSKEKEIQAVRQKGTLQPLYFHKSMIPDSPHEPDPETHTYSEPTIIPLDDVTGNQDNVSDFRNMPWPEPRGNAPPASSNVPTIPNMFPTNIAQFPGGFPPAAFPGMPNFQGPNMVPADGMGWQNGIPPHVMANGMPGAMPPSGMAPPGAMPPGMMVPPENMMMNPEMFAAPNPIFNTVASDNFNMQPNMFPIDFNNMPGPQGPEAFGPGNFRGAMRGRGAGWRGKATGNWEGPSRGRGGSRGGRKAICIYFQRKGSCRQGDNCSFLHPGVNCPY